MELIILNLNNITEEELIEGIKKNNNTIQMTQNSIKSLKSKVTVSKEIETIETTPEIDIFENNAEIDEEIDDLETEVDYYFTSINGLTDSEFLLDDIALFLPSKKANNYNNIMLRIKLELLKNIKDVEDVIGSEQENLTKEDLCDFQEEIKLNQKKLELISKLESITDEETFEDNIENNLIFVPTSGGNIRIIDEISSMPVEFLDRFKGLFDSIIDGTFKNVKRFNSTNNRNSGMSEVRDYQVRVVFDRIGKHDYALVTAFIKKCDSDKGYLESLNLKIKNYEGQKEKLKNNLSNPEFIKLQSDYTKQLYNILNSNEKEQNNPTLKKGGV